MASTFFGGRVWEQLTQAAGSAQNPASVAVAYFGRGGSNLLPLPTGSALVVDAGENTVRSGQTCPADLMVLSRRGVNIYSFPNLHAKIYAFDRYAFVGSANVSRRSSTQLIEALVRIDSQRQINAARDFVLTLCIHQLYAPDLRRLQGLYQPPQFDNSGLNPHASGVLIMDLLMEQGPPRETQVQPPLNAWRQYFGFNPTTAGRGNLPIIELHDASGHFGVARHQVIPHHHNWTIEIAAATPPRPAILRLTRIGINSYEYSVFRPGHIEFTRFDALLRLPNAHVEKIRRWVAI